MKRAALARVKAAVMSKAAARPRVKAAPLATLMLAEMEWEGNGEDGGRQASAAIQLIATAEAGSELFSPAWLTISLFLALSLFFLS